VILPSTLLSCSSGAGLPTNSAALGLGIPGVRSRVGKASTNLASRNRVLSDDDIPLENAKLLIKQFEMLTSRLKSATLVGGEQIVLDGLTGRGWLPGIEMRVGVIFPIRGSV
jgi:hypothetical protein